MDKVHIDDIEGQIDSATVKRPLTDAINADAVALNYYDPLTERVLTLLELVDLLL